MEPIGAAFAAGILLLLLVPPLFSRKARIVRALRRAPPCTTASFDERSVGRIRGTVRCAGAPLRAPFSGRPCAYYEVVIEVLAGLEGNVRNVTRARDGRDFLVQDPDGAALVKVRCAHMLVAESPWVATAGMAAGEQRALATFLTQRVAPAQHWPLDRPLRCREHVLAEGDSVVVCGRGVREPNPDPRAAGGDYRAQATRLVMSASAGAPLYVSNDRGILRHASA